MADLFSLGQEEPMVRIVFLDRDIVPLELVRLEVRRAPSRDTDVIVLCRAEEDRRSRRWDKPLAGNLCIQGLRQLLA